MIEVNNLTDVSVDSKFIKKTARRILKKENKNGFSILIAFVSPEKIKNLNKQYRKKNKATDVLSFPYSDKEKFILPEGKTKVLGEVIICPKEVEKNSRRYKTPFKKELFLILIHGILHLLGYDHEGNKREAEKMERKQRYYLSQIFS